VLFSHSTIIPERLDAFINKYAEHTHDRWAFEKVSRSKKKVIKLYIKISSVMIEPTVKSFFRFRTTGRMARC